MDVLLAGDGDPLRLVLEELDVVVDVEDVLVQLGKVVELRGGGGEQQKWVLVLMDGWRS